MMKTTIALSGIMAAMASGSGGRTCGNDDTQVGMSGRTASSTGGALTHVAHTLTVDGTATHVLKLNAPTGSPGFVGLTFSVTDNAGVQQMATYETTHWQMVDSTECKANIGATTQSTRSQTAELSCNETQYTHLDASQKNFSKAVFAFQLPANSTATKFQYLMLEGHTKAACAAAQTAANQTADETACKLAQTWRKNTIDLSSFSSSMPDAATAAVLAADVCFTQTAPCARSALLESLCTTLAPAPTSSATSLVMTLAGALTLLF
jgi:hypothetical protein